jgi:D-amino peptidase
MSDAILDIRMAGQSFGEIGLNAAAAGYVGAPVVLLSGDDAACNELLDLVPKATAVPLRQAVGQSAAIALHPGKARERLRRAAAEAIASRREVRPFHIPAPIEIEVDLYGPYSVDLVTLVPGVSRGAGARTVTFTASDFEQAYRLIQLLVQLASIKPG